MGGGDNHEPDSFLSKKSMMGISKLLVILSLCLGLAYVMIMADENSTITSRATEKSKFGAPCKVIEGKGDCSHNEYCDLIKNTCQCISNSFDPTTWKCSVPDTTQKKNLTETISTPCGGNMFNGTRKCNSTSICLGDEPTMIWDSVAEECRLKNKEVCSDDMDCASKRCENGTCNCHIGDQTEWNGRLETCIRKVIGEPCLVDRDCFREELSRLQMERYTTQIVCREEKCVCKYPEHEMIEGACRRPLFLGEYCEDIRGYDYCSIKKGLGCPNGRCVCLHRNRRLGRQCDKFPYGHTCHQDDDCEDKFCDIFEVKGHWKSGKCGITLEAKFGTAFRQIPHDIFIIFFVSMSCVY